ncbi:6-bladed beta-propeller [Methanoplanus endosymbiosus]|uniref:6-bladed beta-propeller n=1 Tax=Methanoplanus endosymbiosus TaxID=33865 RepID=A0A9E7PKM0_9EURY|nr:6-bladed beta-propeller [Methanoplanus endosymbiosus]UUX91879.1 6-bladed beta-propeller [Methanoplanus endosymbiosus]
MKSLKYFLIVLAVISVSALLGIASAQGPESSDADTLCILNADSPDYEFVFKWGSYGTYGSPAGVAVDSAGNMYISDFPNHCVWKFDSNGILVSTWGSESAGDGQFSRPEGIAVDYSGNVYVADTYNSCIQKFDGYGTFICKWGSEGAGDGQFSRPEGIAADGSGNVYVADCWNHRIQKFDSDGTFICTWGIKGTADGQFNYPGGAAVDYSGNVYVSDTCNCRVQKFDSNGTFICTWGREGTGDGQFSRPEGITADDSGNVYVVDNENFLVQKFDLNGTFISKWGSYGEGDGQFDYPSGITVDNSGNVCVADTENHRIQKFDSDGTWLSGIFLSPLTGYLDCPKGIAVDNSGSLYVADSENSRIQKFGNDGTFISEFGSKGTGDGLFYYPENIAVDSSGSIYIADTYNYRIQKFSSDGTFISTWGIKGSGDGQFEQPRGIAADSSGSIYVVDTNNHRIQKFGSDGTFICTWGQEGTGEGQFHYPRGAAADSSGNVYIADSCNHRIQKFGSDGTFICTWGQEGTGEGQFKNPDEIFVDNSGNVFVADHRNHRIQKFDSDGTFICTWGSEGTGDGQFRYPEGIGADNSGNIYVADSYNNRIQVFAPVTDPVCTSREIHSSALFSGGETKVTISIKNAEGKPLVLKEQVPAGWMVSRGIDSADSFSFGQDIAQWEWTEVSGENLSINYQLKTPESAETGIYSLNGTLFGQNGIICSIGGNNTINVTKTPPSPAIEWQRCLGGSNDDSANSVSLTSDGGYIATGYTQSDDGDVSGNHGSGDLWVVKLSDAGSLLWQKCLGGSNWDEGRSISQTSNGGYIATGFTCSTDGDVSGNHGYRDLWVVRLSDEGTLMWQRCFGGNSTDSGQSISRTSDGGYIVAGYTKSDDGDVSGNHGLIDVWVVKMSENGTLEWQKCLGGSNYDESFSIHQTSDGGYIVGGYTKSDDGDVSGNHGSVDVWVVRLSENGTLKWQKCLGGSETDVGYDISLTSDGGYILTGYTYSDDGDVSGNHGCEMWVVKLSGDGTLEWQKCLGGSYESNGSGIVQTSDGGYIVAGTTYSNDGDVSGNHGCYDIWIVRLSESGTLKWQKCLGGSNWDFGFSISQVSDGGYIVAGYAGSDDGNVFGNHGDYDVWAVKLAPDSGEIAPVAGFTVDQTNGTLPVTVKFTDLSTGSPVSWNWSFGDGETSTLQNPEHNYTSPGNYTVSLTVTDNAGSDTETKTEYIIVYPKGDFNHNGRVDIGDAAIVSYMVINKAPVDLKADFNVNGAVDIGDASKIAYYVAGKTGSL